MANVSMDSSGPLLDVLASSAAHCAIRDASDDVHGKGAVRDRSRDTIVSEILRVSPGVEGLDHDVEEQLVDIYRRRYWRYIDDVSAD